MNKEDFLTMLKRERMNFEELLAAFGIDRMEIPGVSGLYSMKDILAHLDAYHRALVIWLEEARAGRVYVDEILDQPDLDARNRIVYEANKNRDAVEVLASFRQTWDELEENVRPLSTEELENEDLTAWYVVPRWHRKQELWKCIAGDSYEHQKQHIPDIKKWISKHDTQV